MPHPPLYIDIPSVYSKDGMTFSYVRGEDGMATIHGSGEDGMAFIHVV